MRIRPARAEEATALTELVLRSKAHWGYDAEFLEACREELTVRPGEIADRRIVVAEDADLGMLGVASLEGTAPQGRVGLCFVEPRAIGRGVGRALYSHVMGAARDLGFTRITIESDPNAEPFYRRMGARPVGRTPSGSIAGRELPLLEVVFATPRDGWTHAWTGGRRAVHLGNVAEFQSQFGPASSQAAHYSCLAALISPHPAVLILPRAVPPDWIDLVGGALGWGPVEVYDGLTEPGAASGMDRSRTGPVRRLFPAADPALPVPPDEQASGLSRAVLSRPALAERLKSLGLPLVPWGRTPAFAELAGEPLGPDALRYESKRAAHELFTRLSPAHPGIRVPEQWQAATRRAAARLLRARSREGRATVVKTEHGAGGSGTWVIRDYGFRPPLPRGPLLLEEFVAGETEPRDLTFDGLVDTAGRVHEVGVAVMDVEGTAYQGATVGPGVVPQPLTETLARFGRAVGERIAASGYRGWFDVDFVTGPDGRPAPTEINLRMTGPSVAFMVKARLDETRGGDHLVRTVDHVPLGARLPGPELSALLRETAKRCGGIDAVLVPSIPTASFEPAPRLGVVLAAHTRERLDAAEALVRAAAQDTGRMFTP
ncbi:GNAT family N-acetyltransferase [Streptomyces phyllanthi]|uniref:GNAT family N-acetyltransferase n=1 Tax=Streptomyces phyllanthi TaxID=1803180 RepID=A0A5N8VVK0_9ACTN|nr:GNAT family N-acetyltransferase [Streptomyces phyllanthi]